VRWVYLQPQHTGTGSVVKFMNQIQGLLWNRSQLDWKVNCRHWHIPQRWPKADVAFTFAANPFRRVHTNAVYHQIISDTQTPSRAEIGNFRHWVLKKFGRKGYAFFPISQEVDTAAVGIPLSSSPERATYVGRTTSLEQDLLLILRTLGYNFETLTATLKYHCISGCEDVSPSDRIHTNIAATAGPSIPRPRTRHSEGGRPSGRGVHWRRYGALHSLVR
jgi:hypothetical protein